MFADYEVDVLIYGGQLYAPAGYPALTVPSGYGVDGKPEGVVFIGPFLSEPDLLAVGYAYESATGARMAPDLEARIESITGLTR